MEIKTMSVYEAFEYVMNHYAPLDCEDDLLFKDKYAIISIQDKGGFGFTFNKSKYCRDVLTLYFDDVEYDIDDATMFDETMAGAIIEFVKKNKDRVDNLIIHCYAGLSRSVAVGAFVKYCLGEDNSELLRGDYNRRVYEILMESYGNK